MKTPLAALAVSVALAAPAAADEIRDTINSALESYEAGDITFALEELAIATQLLQGLRTQSLAGFLPEPPEGWSLEVDTSFGAGLAMFGGGTGVEGRYDGPDDSFTLQITADSPALAMFAGMFANPAMLSAMGTVTRIGRERVLEQSGDLTSVIANRVLVQASGGDTELMMDVLRTLDFEGLARFGS